MQQEWISFKDSCSNSFFLSLDIISRGQQLPLRLTARLRALTRDIMIVLPHNIISPTTSLVDIRFLSCTTSKYDLPLKGANPTESSRWPALLHNRYHFFHKLHKRLTRSVASQSLSIANIYSTDLHQFIVIGQQPKIQYLKDYETKHIVEIHTWQTNFFASLKSFSV